MRQQGKFELDHSWTLRVKTMGKVLRPMASVPASDFPSAIGVRHRGRVQGQPVVLRVHPDAAAFPATQTAPCHPRAARPPPGQRTSAANHRRLEQLVLCRPPESGEFLPEWVSKLNTKLELKFYHFGIRSQFSGKINIETASYARKLILAALAQLNLQNRAYDFRASYRCL